MRALSYASRFGEWILSDVKNHRSQCTCIGFYNKFLEFLKSASIMLFIGVFVPLQSS